MDNLLIDNYTKSAQTSKFIIHDRNLFEALFFNVKHIEDIKFHAGVSKCIALGSTDCTVEDGESERRVFVFDSHDSIVRENSTSDAIMLRGRGLDVSSGFCSGQYNKVVTDPSEETSLLTIGNGISDDERRIGIQLTTKGVYSDNVFVDSTGFGEYFRVSSDATLTSGTAVTVDSKGLLVPSEDKDSTIGILVDSCAFVGDLPSVEERNEHRIVCLRGKAMVRREELEKLPANWIVLGNRESELVQVLIR